MNLTIIKEGNPLLKRKAVEVKLPLSDEDKMTITFMMQHLIKSQIPEIAEAEGIQPGVGIAAPQIGVSKRMFCIYTTDLNDKLHKYAFINPVVQEKSEEMIYLPDGEGCLSVDREVPGIVLRHKEIKVNTLVYDIEKKITKKMTLKLTNLLSIIFQHEFDHLEGILYVDRVQDTDNIPKNAKSLFFEE
ncbi:peptide deformylase [Mycoplasmatota bacterium WC44]